MYFYMSSDYTGQVKYSHCDIFICIVRYLAEMKRVFFQMQALKILSVFFMFLLKCDQF